MATYDKEIDYEREETFFKLKEHVVYGSSRVGIRTHDLDLLRLQTQGFSMRSVHYSIGSRQYELTNHLGNVLSVVSDTAAGSHAVNVIPYFSGGSVQEMRADIRSATDYSPFGVALDGRNFTTPPIVETFPAPPQIIYSTNFETSVVVTTGSSTLIDGWVNYSQSTLSIDNGSTKRMKITSTNGTHGANQYFGVAAGQQHTLSVKVDKGTSSSVYLVVFYNCPSMSSTTGSPSTIVTASSNGTYTLNFTSTTGFVLVQVRSSGAGYHYADDIKITNNQPVSTMVYAMDYRYGFQSYEADNEVKGNGNSYTTQFRQYDPRVGRWLSLDPKGVKYPDMSPYNAYGNNPILNVDLKGDTIARFTWDGKYVGWVDDGKAEWIGRRENAIANKDSKGNITSYSHEYFIFADPINDSKALKNGTITHLVFVYETDVKEMLKEAGAFNPDNQGSLDGPLYLKDEGKGGGEFDFSVTKIPSHTWRQPVNFDLSPTDNKTDALFYVKSQKTAHNHFNFGNFMFGAGGQALGVDLGLLLLGAHYNSLKNSGTNGYKPQPDSPDDQLSITFGFLFAKNKNYDQIHIDSSTSTTDEDR